MVGPTGKKGVEGAFVGDEGAKDIILHEMEEMIG
jgi:hypothetical protein